MTRLVGIFKSKNIIMKSFSFTADELQTGRRLDAVLTEKYGDFSRSQWSKQLKLGLVKIDGKLAKSSEKIKFEAQIDGEFPMLETNSLIAPASQPEIIFEDSNVIVINKPAGLVAHPTAKLSQPSVAGAFLDKIVDSDLLRPGIVHRLDKDTSGVMILARNEATKDFLQAQFKDRKVKKIYTALVLGHLDRETARIELPLERSKKNPEKMMVSSSGKMAVSEYKLVAEYPGYSLIEVELLTGRTHQIRAHFAHIGNPIAGDRLYGKQILPAGLDRQFLHASLLSLEVAKDKKMTFKAPLAKDLKVFLGGL